MENRKAVRLGLVCFVWAIAGGIITELIFKNFWFTGDLICGFGVYLAAQWSEAKEGIRDSWKQVRAPKDWDKIKRTIKRWRSFSWKEVGISLYFFLAGFVLLFSLLSLLCLLDFFTSKNLEGHIEFGFRLSFFFATIFATVCCIGFTIDTKGRRGALKMSNEILLYVNPIAGVIWGIIGLVKLISYTIRNFKLICQVCWSATKEAVW